MTSFVNRHSGSVLIDKNNKQNLISGESKLSNYISDCSSYEYDENYESIQGNLKASRAYTNNEQKYPARIDEVNQVQIIKHTKRESFSYHLSDSNSSGFARSYSGSSNSGANTEYIIQEKIEANHQLIMINDQGNNRFHQQGGYNNNQNRGRQGRRRRNRRDSLSSNASSTASKQSSISSGMSGLTSISQRPVNERNQFLQNVYTHNQSRRMTQNTLISSGAGYHSRNNSGINSSTHSQHIKDLALKRLLSANIPKPSLNQIRTIQPYYNDSKCFFLNHSVGYWQREQDRRKASYALNESKRFLDTIQNVRSRSVPVRTARTSKRGNAEENKAIKNNNSPPQVVLRQPRAKSVFTGERLSQESNPQAYGVQEANQEEHFVSNLFGKRDIASPKNNNNTSQKLSVRKLKQKSIINQQLKNQEYETNHPVEHRSVSTNSQFSSNSLEKYKAQRSNSFKSLEGQSTIIIPSKLGSPLIQHKNILPDSQRSSKDYSSGQYNNYHQREASNNTLQSYRSSSLIASPMPRNENREILLSEINEQSKLEDVKTRSGENSNTLTKNLSYKNATSFLDTENKTVQQRPSSTQLITESTSGVCSEIDPIESRDGEISESSVDFPHDNPLQNNVSVHSSSNPVEAIEQEMPIIIRPSSPRDSNNQNRFSNIYVRPNTTNEDPNELQNIRNSILNRVNRKSNFDRHQQREISLTSESPTTIDHAATVLSRVAKFTKKSFAVNSKNNNDEFKFNDKISSFRSYNSTVPNKQNLTLSNNAGNLSFSNNNNANNSNNNQAQNSMNIKESYLDFSKRTMQNKDNYSRSNSINRSNNVPNAPGPFNFIGVPRVQTNPIVKRNNYGAQGMGLTGNVSHSLNKRLQSFENKQPFEQDCNLAAGNISQEQESSSILEIIENKFQNHFTPGDIQKLESMFSHQTSKRLSTLEQNTTTTSDDTLSLSESYSMQSEITEEIPSKPLQPLDQIKLKVRIILSKDWAKDGDRLQWSKVNKRELGL